MRHKHLSARRAIGSLFSVLFAMWAVFASAADMDDVPWDRWDNQAAATRSIIETGEIEPDRREELRAEFEMQRNEAIAVSQKAGEEIERIEAELSALGPAPEEGVTEAAATAKIRAELNQQLADMRATQGRAERAATRARGLVDDLAALAQRRFVELLGELKPSPAWPERWGAAISYLGQIGQAVHSEVVSMSQEDGMNQRLTRRLPLAVLAFLSALVVAVGLRGGILHLMLRSAGSSARRRNRLIIGIGATLTRIMALLIAAVLFFVGINLLDVFGKVGEALFTGVGLGLFLLVASYAIAAALFSPMAAGLRPSLLNDATARKGFIATLALGFILFLSSVLDTVAEVLPPSDEASSVFNFVLIALGAVALWRVTDVIQESVKTSEEQEEAAISNQLTLVLRRLLIAVALIAPVLALIGYEFAARYLFLPSVVSLGAIAVAHLIFVVIREAVEVYLADTGEVNGDVQGQRLRLIPVLIGFLLFCLLLPILALIWGASWTDLTVAYDAIAAGFQVGDVALSPMDFVTFALVFVIGYTLTRTAQRILRLSVLPKAGMNHGGADAIGAGVGYVGVFLSALAAISAAGLDLSNLAIVAGALSVGIGFGLQNIVNNFVSGIILLVERPIRVGDWIEVAGISGYVKKVNVRSTEIETFDRASYILPNSDLISGAVLNWTHSDTTGRVIAPVGVAYGTDLRLVERVLLDIARDHPMVIASPAPVAYLMGFGADSIDFELRVFLRDVNWMLSVTSDLNYQIAARFEEEGIEIPFAQRDLNIKNPDALVQALRRSDAGSTSDHS